MSKKFGAGSIVVLYLQNPREKIWGAILSLNPIGIMIRGVDINSFDDWSRSILNQSESIGLSTMFIPMGRIEKAILDESVGSYKSLSDQFYERVGQPVSDYLDLSFQEEEDIL